MPAMSECGHYNSHEEEDEHYKFRVCDDCGATKIFIKVINTWTGWAS